MIRRLTRDYISKLVMIDDGSISSGDRDEMAIPSYMHPNPLIRWLMWKRYDCIFELCKLRQEQAVLEFGCGIGLFLPTLCAAANSVYAIDLFPDIAKRLAQDYGLAVSFPSSVAEIPEKSLDVVVAADVLEHVDDVGRFVSDFRDRLKKDGRLLVSGPTEGAIYKLGRLFAGFAGKGGYHHRNIEDIRSSIEKNGFRVIGRRALPFPIPPYLFLIYEFQAQ